ncbi:MAG TPA: alpha/beta hydrolase [Roseateles sp.]|nr:alpha/beta hydrolase [Roseateles sp.]
MATCKRLLMALCAAATSLAAAAQSAPKVVDVPTREGVSARILFIAPPDPKATLLLLPGGHGGLQLFPIGSMKWGSGNFLVRARQLFVEQGVAVAVVDAPSDRQAPPYLGGFRQTPAHAADLKALVAWARANSKGPVWLVGTSRGTQSAAYAATELQGPDGPDGLVLSSTILSDPKGRPVPAMPLGKIRVPVLVVHHEQDGCEHCAYSDLPALMAKLANSPKAQLLAFKGGENKGDPCEAQAYHGFNGLEADVVGQTVAWVLAK